MKNYCNRYLNFFYGVHSAFPAEVPHLTFEGINSGWRAALEALQYPFDNSNLMPVEFVNMANFETIATVLTQTGLNESMNQALQNFLNSQVICIDKIYFKPNDAESLQAFTSLSPGYSGATPWVTLAVFNQNVIGGFKQEEISLSLTGSSANNSQNVANRTMYNIDRFEADVNLQITNGFSFVLTFNHQAIADLQGFSGTLSCRIKEIYPLAQWAAKVETEMNGLKDWQLKQLLRESMGEEIETF